MKTKLIVMMLAIAMVFGASACSKEESKEVKQTDTEVVSEEKEAPKDEKTSSAETEKEEKEETKEEAPQEEPVQKEAEPAETPKEEPQAPVVQDTQPEEEPAAPAPEVKKASKETASQYIGQSASALVAAIGEPGSKTYADSCIGDGEDGEWYYDGFTVYTYRENGSERVEDVF